MANNDTTDMNRGRERRLIHLQKLSRGGKGGNEAFGGVAGKNSVSLSLAELFFYFFIFYLFWDLQGSFV